MSLEKNYRLLENAHPSHGNLRTIFDVVLPRIRRYHGQHMDAGSKLEAAGMIDSAEDMFVAAARARRAIKAFIKICRDAGFNNATGPDQQNHQR
jgi:hypothetical protein